jgi:hypothetical protein
MLLLSGGVADEILAKQERERGRKRDLMDEDVPDLHDPSRKRARSISSSSSHSVSTISTNLSRSISPDLRSSHRLPNSRDGDERAPLASKDRPRKRRYSGSSSGYSHSSPAPDRRLSPATEREMERNTRRKRRDASPTQRGRSRDSSKRGSWRARSRSQSRERSRIVRGRRSMTPSSVREPTKTRHQREPDVRRGQPANVRQDQFIPPPRERSLSPFSKRLALTQAMNMGR